MAELLGTTIGNIRVVGHLAKGGMGEVYVGFDEKLERRVALKALRWRQRLDARSKARFLREARILSQLDDPGICRIFDYIESGGSDYLVLELIEGRNLRQAFDQGLEPSLRSRIAERITGALVTAHMKGVIHRDLKPDNVMLTPGGDVKVLDFGLAQSEDAREEPPEEDAPRGAEPDRPRSSVLGTAAYMSPEQVHGQRLTAASDMYSLGLLLQEVFTGRPAHPVLPPTAILFRAMEGKSEPVTGVDRDLAVLLNRLKSVAPEARPSAAETLEPLRWIRGKPQRRFRRLLASATLLAAASGLAKYTFDLRQERAAAVEAREEAEGVAAFLTGLFEVADPAEARGRTITALELLDSGARKARRELDGQPLVQARVLGAIGTVYRRLALYDEAAEFLERALELRTGRLGGDHPDIAESLNELGRLCWNRGWFERGESLLLRALEIREKALGPEHLDVAQTLDLCRREALQRS